MDEEFREQRRYPRSEFIYPVKFDIYSPGLGVRSFSGYMQNLSVGGVSIHFEDKYGRIDLDGLRGLRIKIGLSMPDGEKVYLIAVVHWIRREIIERKLSVVMGLEFREIEDWQLEKLEKFIRIKHKDQKMLWNLWEDYVQPGLR